MPMNRIFFLACATIIAAASSVPAYARPCSDLDSPRERSACYVRSAIYRAEAAAYEAKERYASPKPTVKAKPTCGLTKEYVDGTVKFRDTCTGEWAQRTIPWEETG
jgi:hypothetical protein